MQRALHLTRRGLGPAAAAITSTSSRRGPVLLRRGLASSAASSDDGGVNAPASFSPEKMERGK